MQTHLNFFNLSMESIACLVNTMALIKALTRGRLEIENGAREAVSTLIRSRGTKLESTGNSIGLTTCKDEDLLAASVVMLSNVSKYGTPNYLIQQFMKSNAHLYNVHSILLQFFPFKAKRCEHGECNCIVFWADEEMTTMLARRMPGILKRLTDPLCLLPCLTCLTNGCHECSREGPLRVEGPLPVEQSDEGFRLRESDSHVVSEILDKVRAGFIRPGEPIFICIPLNDARRDDWTNVLARSFRSIYAEVGGARVMVSKIMESWLPGDKLEVISVDQYNICSIVYRLIEIFTNVALTFWFRVDGFSSSLVARSIIRDCLKDSQGRVPAAEAYVKKAIVNTYDNHICQALTFGVNRLSLIAGGVNLICFICWAAFIAFEGGHCSPPLSIPRVAVIVTAICIALLMDCLYLFTKKRDYKLLLVIILEIICIVAVILVATTLVINSFRKWVYSAVQALVWVKWGMGSYILDTDLRDNSGVLVLCSAFLINAALAGIRSNWRAAWAWKGILGI